MTKGIWLKIGSSDCAIWVDNRLPNDTVSWNGACVDGKANGHGIEVRSFTKNGKRIEERYEGDFRHGRRHGIGNFQWSNGDRYDGEWRDGETHGKGTLIWSNGDSYRGDWWKNEKHGRGVFYFAQSRNRYVGEWRHNKKEGRGTFYYRSGNSFAGVFRDDAINGIGICYVKRTDKYGRCEMQRSRFVRWVE